MNLNKILVILGEPQSVFSELLAKFIKSKKFKKNNFKFIFVGSKNLFEKQVRNLNYRIKINEISKLEDSKKNKVNFINVKFKFDKIFSKLSNYSKSYVMKCFNLGLKIIKSKKNIALLNGPISKKHFLNNEYYGVTEFLAKKTNSKNQVMLIFNKKLSVSPITTHVPLKHVAKNITKKKIINNVNIINNFFLNKFGKKPLFSILGLNPHCETIDKFSEEENIILPAINYLKKKKINIEGPFSADTFFIKKNIIKYDVVIGMYHDQVLTPIKTLFNFNAINVTLGLPFIRVSPDHGPNNQMLGKNKSDPSSIFCAVDFFKMLK